MHSLRRAERFTSLPSSKTSASICFASAVWLRAQTQVATLEDLIARLPKDRPLAKTLQALERLGPVSAADAASLSAAREGRNFIDTKALSLTFISTRAADFVRPSQAAGSTTSADCGLTLSSYAVTFSGLHKAII